MLQLGPVVLLISTVDSLTVADQSNTVYSDVSYSAPARYALYKNSNSTLPPLPLLQTSVRMSSGD